MNHALSISHPRLAAVCYVLPPEMAALIEPHLEALGEPFRFCIRRMERSKLGVGPAAVFVILPELHRYTAARKVLEKMCSRVRAE